MTDGAELFIVEGKAAANAVRQVLDIDSQVVYAVQGKPMNAARASDSQVRRNERVDEMIRRVTRNRSDIDDPEHEPYERVILLTDGDVDGVHAKALLLVLLARVLPDLVTSGRLHTVRAPQFAVTCNGREPLFAYSHKGRDSAVEQLVGAGATNVKTHHYKGLASMDGDVLWNVCVNPETRRMTPLTMEQADTARRALGG